MSKASDVYAFGKILLYMYNNERSSDALEAFREASGGRRISGGKQDLPPFPADMPAAFEVGEPILLQEYALTAAYGAFLLNLELYLWPHNLSRVL